MWGEVRLIFFFLSAELINNAGTKQCVTEGLVWFSTDNIPHVSKFCMLRYSQKACPGPGICCGGESMLSWGALPCAF